MSEAAALDPMCQGAATQLINSGEFSGKLNETSVLHLAGKARKLVLVGLGEGRNLTAEKIRQAAGTGMRAALKGKVSSVAMPLVCGDSLDAATCAQAMVEGAMLGAYRFDRLKSDAKTLELAEIILTLPQDLPTEGAQTGADKGVIMAEATMMARDLVNLPGNMMTPSHMADAARQIAAQTAPS